MQIKKLGSLFLETIRYRLGVESVQLTYAVCVSVREINMAVGPVITAPPPLSPYDWKGACLPRSIYCESGFLTQSIYFGELGSASLLTLAHKELKDTLLDDIIVEHCKLHASLHDSFSEQIGELQLNQKERQALYCRARGLTAKETAQEMKVNYRSVEYLLKIAKNKLGAQSLPEAVHKAVCTRQLRI